MIKKITNYFIKLGGNLKDLEEGSELKRILRLMDTAEQVDLTEVDELKPRRGKRKAKGRAIKTKKNAQVLSKKGSLHESPLNIYRDEELFSSIGQYDMLLDATRRSTVD